MAEAWAKLDIALRDALPVLSGGELKVWIAYRLRANEDGEAWPGLGVLAKDTGLSTGRASKHRNTLIAKGGLVPVGNTRGNRGTFGAPRFRVCIPTDRKSKTPHGESAARQSGRTTKDTSTVRRKRPAPYGENGLRSRTNEVEPVNQQQQVVVEEIFTAYEELVHRKPKWRGAEDRKLAALLHEHDAKRIIQAVERWLLEGTDWDVKEGFPFCAFADRIADYLPRGSTVDDNRPSQDGLVPVDMGTPGRPRKVMCAPDVAKNYIDGGHAKEWVEPETKQ